MSDLYARPDHWTDALPQSWQQSINTNPLLNALGRALNRQPIDLERAARDTYGTPEQQAEADRQWLIQKAQGPSWLERNPTAADGVNKLGMLANFLGPGVKLPAAAPKPTGIRAYHGSPHDFDRFDISKIGTGEGAQAYGPGLYFAEREGVAKSYRDNLQRPAAFVPSVNGRVMTREELPLVDTMRFRGGFDGAIDYLTRSIGEMNKARAGGWFAREQPKSQWQIEYERQLGILTGWRDSGARVNWERPPPQPGRMYEVRINADPERFLDWDKPLSGQPSAARPILEKALSNDYYDANAPIGQILRGELLKPETATALREAGVPGTRYLDQNSRGIGEGTRNTVVWDDKLIEILRKYGLWPLVPAGTAAALNQQEPPL